MICGGAIFEAGTAKAAWPQTHPAYFEPGATPPVVELMPAWAHHNFQVVDGRINPQEEYGIGKRFDNFRDWNSDPSEKSGSIYLA